ncbi:MAG: superoxide dismutase [Caulobacter sp.]|nr:superoxide dismutase [Caulobacter sp.]
MFILPDLPYRRDALGPVISAETLRFHHGKHHRTYVDTLNRLLDEAGDHPDSLEAVIRQTAGDPGQAKLFNNAAQAWNHAFFWQAMSAEAARPDGVLAEAIAAAFGGLPGLKTNFVNAGAEHFGSGWVWLIAGASGLKVITTHDAKGPVPMDGVTALLVCDLWEHAYYLDYQNDRKGFLEAWFDALPNWTFAAAQFAAHQKRGPAWAYPAPVPAERNAAAS